MNWVVCLGSFMGGEIEPGTFHGGDIEPGTFHGGEIEPGTFHGVGTDKAKSESDSQKLEEVKYPSENDGEGTSGEDGSDDASMLHAS